MKRVMLQIYVNDAASAIKLYEKAFDAKLMEIHHTPEGKVYHSELDVDGQVLAVADRDSSDGESDITGNIMQFCLHFEKGNEAFVQRAYDALCENGTVRVPLGSCDYSSCMTDIVDCFGVRWCIFTA
ncbi:MAG TPA: VOC family protein [Candidatus Pelethocola excrementipullorum]|nr:VOC family protein [Candidatus Pelethocola excrementipullorum]